MIGTAAPRQGEIWFVYTPGNPDDPHQPRPALIVSEDDRNVALNTAMVVPIFSRGWPGPTHVPLRRGAGGVPHDSILFCEELTTLNHHFLAEGPVGPPVARRVIEQIVGAVRRALGEVVPKLP